jgi:hypothetical protein
MVLPTTILLSPGATSDPGWVDNGDYTESIIWNFTDSADYTLFNSSVSGGTAQLMSVNETMVENSTAEYLLGTSTNIDNQSVPDSMVLDDTSLPVQMLVLQPGPEGIDNYMDEWFSAWNPGDGDLTMNPQYDPVPADSKRCRIVMQFDLSAVPSGSTILDATLWLFEKPSKATPITYHIHALNLSFNELGMSWIERDNGLYWSKAGGDFSTESFSNGTVDGTAGWQDFDLTRLVDLWTRGTVPNNGFIIVPRDETFDGSKNFASSDANKPEQWPRLVVNYTFGEVVGTYESMPQGPGTNSTFTLANWEDGILSRATEEFNGSGISTLWDWTNDPNLTGGSVNFDRLGWLNVTGSQPTDLHNATIGCNFLHQNLTGNFRAVTNLQGYFAADGMGAGLLVKSDNITWLALYMSGVPGDSRLVAESYKGGVSTVLGSTPWATTTAHLRIDRIGGTYLLLSSPNGLSWASVASYTPQYDFTIKVEAGLCVFSGGLALNPIVEFDFIRIEPIGQSPTLEMRVRAGNSTSLVDPSWLPWAAPVGPDSGTVLGLEGMYLQYQITLRSTCSWLTPTFSGFSCHYEHYLPDGYFTTMSVYPNDLRTWDNMTVTHSVANGTIDCYYSSDLGDSWSYLGSGASFLLGVTEPSMMLLVVLITFDTLTTPTIDTIELHYTKSIASFHVTAPATTDAGELFPITIEARDPLNNLATDWNGTVTLHALDAAGTGDASAELYVIQAYIPLGGTLTLWTQRYDSAETIRIIARAGTAQGISAPIIVSSGAIASLTLTPGNVTMFEHDSETFTATALDAYGNPITEIPIIWSIDASLGTLNIAQGSVVILTAGSYGSGGYLNVSCSGMTVPRWIDVVQERFAPTFTSPLPDQTKTEDFGEWTIDISGNVTDLEDPVSMLSWYAANESIVDVIGENRTGDFDITFSTIDDVVGSADITIFVVDSDGMQTSTAIHVTITPVNDPPNIDPVDPIVVRYGATYVFDFIHYISDPDDPVDDLILSVDSANIPYTVVDGQFVTFIYPQSMVGITKTVVITVRDLAGASDSTAILVTVSDDQVPVQSRMLPSVELDQGQLIEDVAYLPDYFSDADDDILIYDISCEHSRIRVKTDGHINVTAPNDWWGTEYAIVRAIDPSGARAEGVMQITVRQVNHPPVLEGVPDLMVHYDLRYMFDLAQYVEDKDVYPEEFLFSATDAHCTFTGTMMSVLYPLSMNNTVNPVTITVTDGSHSDMCLINITVSANYPPELLSGVSLPDHSFQEDNPTSYPVGSNLEDYFTDSEDGGLLMFTAFSQDSNVTANAIDDGTYTWIVEFDTTPNYYGDSFTVIRATDSDGAIVERTIILEIVPVPDTPNFDLPTGFIATEGEQVLLSLGQYLTDPDSSIEAGDFTFHVSVISASAGTAAACLEYISILPGMIVFEFPEGFVGDEKELVYELEVHATDQDGKFATSTMILTVGKIPQEQNTLFLIGMLVTGGVAAGMFVFMVRMRRKPFVVHDMMLIHNDGFLIGRYAGHSHIEGEIDEDILSGMLTAVLNFVEDSMHTNQDQLKTFGFKEFQVLVKRGTKSFAAIVFEGDLPDNLDKPLGEFIGTFERVYRNKVKSWTGDIETDFAGVELLIQSFVKEHSKHRGGKAQKLWVSKKQGESGGATAK